MSPYRQSGSVWRSNLDGVHWLADQRSEGDSSSIGVVGVIQRSITEANLINTCSIIKHTDTINVQLHNYTTRSTHHYRVVSFWKAVCGSGHIDSGIVAAGGHVPTSRPVEVVAASLWTSTKEVELAYLDAVTRHCRGVLYHGHEVRSSSGQACAAQGCYKWCRTVYCFHIPGEGDVGLDGGNAISRRCSGDASVLGAREGKVEGHLQGLSEGGGHL